MATEWIGVGFFAVPASAVNVTFRNTVANVFVNGGSGETNANERKMFDTVIRLSANGQLPATAYTLSAPLKASMRDEIATLLAGTPSARCVIMFQEPVAGRAINEVYYSNVNGVNVGSLFTWNDWIAGMQTRFGLQVIPESA